MLNDLVEKAGNRVLVSGAPHGFANQFGNLDNAEFI
jgi:hypothetical protein